VFFGYLVLILGTLIYNEIITIPFFGFNKNTENNIAKREEELEAEVLPLINALNGSLDKTNIDYTQIQNDSKMFDKEADDEKLI
jgi:hypothetical protein